MSRIAAGCRQPPRATCVWVLGVAIPSKSRWKGAEELRPKYPLLDQPPGALPTDSADCMYEDPL
eukprot:6802936-Alexandrium_andersonii.AAC.1